MPALLELKKRFDIISAQYGASPKSRLHEMMSSRIYFYMLYGIVSTYRDSEEPFQDIANRLSDTWDEAFEVLLIGLKQKLQKGDDRSESHTNI